MNTYDSRIHSLGLLTKEETLKSINYKVKPNTLVLETIEPFPGYLGENLPDDTKPEAVYFITEKKYPNELIYRLSKKIRRFVSFDYDAIPAEILINNNLFYSIRIRYIDSYDRLFELQNWFFDEGIEFMKKKNVHSVALINLKKIFQLEKVTQHIYKDMEDENLYYFEIPVELSWSLFKKITVKTKNNIDYNNFDTAKAYVFYNKITDYARIYAKKINLDLLEEIRNRYITELNKVIQP